MFYAELLGPISVHKRARVFQDIQSSALLLCILCLAIQLIGITAVAAYYGIFQPLVLPNSETASVIDWIQALALPYLDFWLMELLKDCTSMHFVHQWMHNAVDHPVLHKLHTLHHEYKANLNAINGAQILPLVLALENSIGPVILVAFKSIVLGLPPSISVVSYLLLISSEGSAHSCNPFSVCYYNPLLDYIVKGNIAHNLHHAMPNTQLHIVPWHHFWQGYAKDLELYNKIMKMNISM